PERLNLPPGSPVDGVSPERRTRAELHLRVLDADREDGAILLARLDQVDRSTLAEVGALDAPFLLKIDDRCKLSGFARLTSTGAATARVQQSLAHEMQWMWPTSGQADGDGETAFGAYRATFRASGNDIERRITAYTNIWGAGGGALKPRTDRPAL